MDLKKFNFPDVSLLITHYNRPASLKRLFDRFADLNCSFGEIIVSDDCSTAENLKQVEDLHLDFEFKLVTTPVNKGLGNNINKGQNAVGEPYTLYVQEDFVPKDVFPERFSEALTLLKDDNSVDLVRFYAYHKYPYLSPLSNGFSLMKFNPSNFLGTYKKFYVYSDHPHLRRSNFLEKFGNYKEGVNVEKAEYNMMMSFLKHKGKALFYDAYQDIFDQVNSIEEPSTFKRNWKRHPTNLPIRIARHLYRHIKFNLDYLT